MADLGAALRFMEGSEVAEVAEVLLLVAEVDTLVVVLGSGLLIRLVAVAVHIIRGRIKITCKIQ